MEFRHDCPVRVELRKTEKNIKVERILVTHSLWWSKIDCKNTWEESNFDTWNCDLLRFIKDLFMTECNFSFDKHPLFSWSTLWQIYKKTCTVCIHLNHLNPTAEIKIFFEFMTKKNEKVATMTYYWNTVFSTDTLISRHIFFFSTKGTFLKNVKVGFEMKLFYVQLWNTPPRKNINIEFERFI